MVTMGQIQLSMISTFALFLKSHTSIVLQNYDFLSQCVINVPEPITKSPMIKFTVVNEIFIQVCNAYMSSFIDRVHSDTFG